MRFTPPALIDPRVQAAWITALDIGSPAACEALAQCVAGCEDPGAVAQSLLGVLFITRRSHLPGVNAVARNLIVHCGAQPLLLVAQGVDIPAHLVRATALAMGEAERGGVSMRTCPQGNILHYLMHSRQRAALVDLLQPARGWHTQAWINHPNQEGFTALMTLWRLPPSHHSPTPVTWELALALLRHGADPLLCGWAGFTAMDHMTLARQSSELRSLFECSSTAREQVMAHWNAIEQHAALDGGTAGARPGRAAGRL